VGTGPFELEKYIQGSKLLFKRFKNYRIKGMPYLDRLEIDIIPDLNTEISAFRNREIDCLMTNDAVAIQSLQSAGFRNTGKKSPNLADIDYFLFNSKDPAVPFSKLQVRQAVMHSIDYQNVAKALTGGMGFATNQFGIKGAYSYNPNVKFYSYNLKKAKELLKKAGYPNGFTTTIFTRADLKPTAEALQASIKPIGINAKIQILDKALLNKMQVADSIQGIVIGKGASQLDFTKNYIRLYSSEGIKNQGIMIFPADYEKALFGARAANTLAEKKKLLQIASQKLVEEYCLLVPMDVAFYQCFTQANVHGLGMYEASLQAWTPEAAWVD
jgi:peptide/nickel transport system substrate-binding protein